MKCVFPSWDCIAELHIQIILTASQLGSNFHIISKVVITQQVTSVKNSQATVCSSSVLGAFNGDQFVYSISEYLCPDESQLTLGCDELSLSVR
jgi:hypothetical protein